MAQHCSDCTIEAINFDVCLREKYAISVEDESTQIYVPKKRPGQQALTDSSSVLTVPSVVILSNFSICHAGKVASVKDTLTFVTEIDLTKNLISHWQEVVLILMYCPRVICVNLSYNPIDKVDSDTQTITSLKELILNHTYVPFQLLPTIIATLPNVETLHLNFNEYTETTIHTAENTLSQSITTLHFCGNAITHLSKLCRVGELLPNLQTLVITDSDLSEFDGDGPEIMLCFGKLQSLNISNGKITTWEAIDGINKLPVLTELRMRGLPLTQSGEQDGRSEIIARLPKITKLDGKKVTSDEKTDAERSYVEKYKDTAEKPARYDELKQKQQSEQKAEDARNAQKPAKIITTFAEAVRDKFATSEDFVDNMGVYVPKKRKGREALTDSDILLIVPSVVILSGGAISQAGNVESIKNTLISVRELDLTNNKITDWKEILSITIHCPHVYFINLTQNPVEVADPSSQTIATIKELVLNKTNIPMDLLPNVLTTLPNLETLHLSLNKYASISLNTPLSTTITTLYFCGNFITDAPQLCKIGEILPTLHTLILTDTEITNFNEDPTKIAACFGKLKHLSLNRCQISTWEAVDDLNNWPCLSELRLLGVPLIENIEREGRFEVIARLSRLSILNGTDVNEHEREDAERAFLRSYFNTDPKPARYDELTTKHGRLEPITDVHFTQPTYMMTFRFWFENRIDEKTIDTRQTVQDLKQSLKAVCNMDPREFILYYRDEDAGYGDEELKYPDKVLYTIGLHEMDSFFIEPKYVRPGMSKM